MSTTTDGSSPLKGDPSSESKGMPAQPISDTEMEDPVSKENKVIPDFTRNTDSVDTVLNTTAEAIVKNTDSDDTIPFHPPSDVEMDTDKSDSKSDAKSDSKSHSKSRAKSSPELELQIPERRER